MRKQIFTFLTALFLSFSTFAAEFKPFTQAEFDVAMQQGKPILVDVYADWCSTCKRQLHILTPMLAEPEFAGLTAFKVNYDTQDDVLKALNVRNKSTLILFNQGKEVRRSIGQTNKEKLRQFISLP